MLVESRGSSEEGYVIVIICAVRGARHGHQRAGHTQAARTRAGLGASLRRMKKRCLRSGDPTLDRSIELMKTKRVPGGSCLFQGYDRSRSQLPACALHACLRVSIPLKLYTHSCMYGPLCHVWNALSTHTQYFSIFSHLLSMMYWCLGSSYIVYSICLFLTLFIIYLRYGPLHDIPPLRRRVLAAPIR